MIVFVDFKCDNCAHVWEKMFRSRAKMVRKLQCPQCKLHAGFRLYNSRQNHIHPDHSSQYGKFQPAFGQVVKDYAHKRKLLKEFDVSEASDPVRGSRSFRDNMPTPHSMASLADSTEFVSKPNSSKE